MGKSFLEKTLGKAKKSLAVLVAGAMLGIGGIAYAKDINKEGWPLPDKTKYNLIEEPIIEEIEYEHEGKTIYFKAKIEHYANTPQKESIPRYKEYKTLSFEGQTFMYIILESKGTLGAYDLTILTDRDGDGLMETKYTDAEEFGKDDYLPRWVLEKLVK